MGVQVTLVRSLANPRDQIDSPTYLYARALLSNREVVNRETGLSAYANAKSYFGGSIGSEGGD